LLLALVLPMPHHDTACRGQTVQADEDGCLFVISEFYPCATCGDEYFVISNLGNSYGDLEGWGVSDGEGSLMFCRSLSVAPRGSFTVSWNGTSFRAAYGVSPSMSVDELYSQGSAALNGTFRLGDSGDSITLFSPQHAAVDFVAYGSCNATSPLWTGDPVPSVKRGEVARRIRVGGAFRDSNDATDWTHFREFRYGYTEYLPKSFTVGQGDLTAFTSPDSSLDVVLETLDGATDSISICTYEFSSTPIATALWKATSRGVVVRVLVDGSPAGGMDDDEIICLSVLAAEGVDVRTVRGNSSRGMVQHVGEVHAKYLIVDHIHSIVFSENLVEQGVPTDRLFGNRGWGVRIGSQELASALELIFEDDSRASRPDVVPWTSDARWNRSATLPAFPTTYHYEGMIAPLTLNEPATVSIYLSPDCSITEPYLSGLLRLARSLEAEQFQADLYWEDRWTASEQRSPILGEILSELRRGGSTRLLFDSSWFNLERNGEVVSSMFENATLAGMDGQFALLDSSSPIESLHNKGAIIDGRYLLVSSNNWVCASFARNRELGLLVDSKEISMYFSEAFALDWLPDKTPPTVDAGQNRTILIGEVALLSSNLSSDDRAIAGFYWDTDGDGEAESRNRSVEFLGIVPGSFTVMLIVEDAWGNRATDEVTIVVLALDGPGRDGKDSFVRGLGWAVPLVVGAGILFVRWRRGRVSSGDSRKLNHSRRS
jgi:hypothetical protein